MSYGVFRINGQGRYGLILVASFEEDMIRVIDDSIKSDFTRIFEENIMLTEKEESVLPKVPTGVLCATIQSGDNINGNLFYPFESVMCLSDSQDSLKVSPPPLAYDSMKMNDSCDLHIPSPLRTHLLMGDGADTPINTKLKDDTTDVNISDSAEIIITKK